MKRCLVATALLLSVLSYCFAEDTAASLQDDLDSARHKKSMGIGFTVAGGVVLAATSIFYVADLAAISVESEFLFLRNVHDLGRRYPDLGRNFADRLLPGNRRARYRDSKHHRRSDPSASRAGRPRCPERELRYVLRARADLSPCQQRCRFGTQSQILNRLDRRSSLLRIVFRA